MAAFLKDHPLYSHDKMLNAVWFALVGLEVLIVVGVVAQVGRSYLRSRIKQAVL